MCACVFIQWIERFSCNRRTTTKWRFLLVRHSKQNFFSFIKGVRICWCFVSFFIVFYYSLNFNGGNFFFFSPSLYLSIGSHLKWYDVSFYYFYSFYQSLVYIYFNHLCLDNLRKILRNFWKYFPSHLWTTTKFQFCDVCASEWACVRPIFVFLDVFIFGRIEFFFTFVLFAFDDTDSYRICVDLLGFIFLKTERGKTSKRFKQTNRQNHYTLWNLIFCFLSEWFLWNRNQSLYLCALHILHIHHIILHFALLVMRMSAYMFLLWICVSCVGTTNRHFSRKKKILSRLQWDVPLIWQECWNLSQ